MKNSDHPVIKRLEAVFGTIPSSLKAGLDDPESDVGNTLLKTLGELDKAVGARKDAENSLLDMITMGIGVKLHDPFADGTPRGLADGDCQKCEEGDCPSHPENLDKSIPKEMEDAIERARRQAGINQKTLAYRVGRSTSVGEGLLHAIRDLAVTSLEHATVNGDRDTHPALHLSLVELVNKAESCIEQSQEMTNDKLEKYNIIPGKESQF